MAELMPELLNSPVPVLFAIGIAIQTLLQMYGGRWGKRLALCVLPLPGLGVTALLFGVLHLFYYTEFTRAALVDHLFGWKSDSDALHCYCCFWVCTLFMAAIWLVNERPLQTRGRFVFERRNAVAITLATLALVLGSAALFYVPLEVAVERGDLSLVRRRLAFNLEGVCVENGCITPGIDDGTFYDPLLPLAVKNRHLEVARLLLERGADVDGRIDREPPLIDALRNRDAQMVRLLLEHGAYVSPGTENRAAELLQQRATPRPQ